MYRLTIMYGDWGRGVTQENESMELSNQFILKEFIKYVLFINENAKSKAELALYTTAFP